MISYTAPDLKLIISDIDNTLIHRLNLELDKEDLDSRKLAEVDRNSYISLKTIRAIEKIQNLGIPFILATSRRIATYKNILKFVKPSYAIVEDGCIILDHNGAIELQWVKRLEDYIGPIDDVMESLHNRGKLWDFKATLLEIELTEKKFVVIDDGFMASFKIKLPMEIDSYSSDDIKNYLHTSGVKIPNFLKVSINSKYQSISIIPSLAGKAYAADYLLNKLGIRLRNVAVLGDDYNDEELLTRAGYPIALASAQEKIKKLVLNREGIVVPEGRHKGTYAMLDLLIHSIKANMYNQ